MISKSGAIFFLSVALLIGVNAADKAKVPGDQELKTLTRDSLLAFNKAVAAKDFTGFLGQVSSVWQKQVTAKKLAEVFQTFIDKQIDIGFVAKGEPEFDKAPEINSDGVLVLEGHYPTTPDNVQFKLKYINEKGAWKLFGISVDVANGRMPEEKELRDLIMESLDEFNQAVKQEDFGDFYDQVAKVWQKQTTPEKLQALFQSFIDQQVDFTPALSLDPVFDSPPAIDEKGILIAKGTLPSKPSKVRFELGYIRELPDWKLVKINITVGRDAEEKKEE